MYFPYVLVFVVPIAIVALAAWLNRRSGRGSALGLLAIIVLGLSHGAEVVVLLLLPVLITFSYAIARTLRPVAPTGSLGACGAAARLPW